VSSTEPFSPTMSSERTRVAPRQAWPGYAAAAWSFLFALPHLYWALGGRMGLSFSLALKGQAEADLIADPSFQASGLWGVAVLLAIASGIGLLTAHPPRRTSLRRIVAIGAWGVAAVTGLRALIYPGFIFSGLRVLGMIETAADADPNWFRWDLVLWAPWFLLGAVLFAFSARSLAAGRREPSRSW